MAVLISKFSSPVAVSPTALASTYTKGQHPMVDGYGQHNGHKVRGSDGRQYWISRTGKRHNGIAADIAVVVGAPVYASAGGKVLTAGAFGGCGITVRVESPPGWIAKYCHLSQVTVSVGQQVRQRQLIGYTGNTGDSEGAHLHFVLIDPNGNRVPDPIRVLGIIGTSQLVVWSGVGLGLAALTYGVYHVTQKGL